MDKTFFKIYRPGILSFFHQAICIDTTPTSFTAILFSHYASEFLNHSLWKRKSSHFQQRTMCHQLSYRSLRNFSIDCPNNHWTQHTHYRKYFFLDLVKFFKTPKSNYFNQDFEQKGNNTQLVIVKHVNNRIIYHHKTFWNIFQIFIYLFKLKKSVLL